jgi:molybdopterin molybdotransferase
MSEPDVSDLLTVQQAIAILDATPVAPRVIRVPLAAAQGARLAEDLAADRDYPPFDKSLMDGYAVRAADVATTPADLRITGEIPAGQVSSRPINPGEAVAIMTGAPLPPGADGVIPIEFVQVTGDRARILSATGDPRRFVARQGSDAAQGQAALARGTMIQAAQVAAAATVGAATLSVFAKPTAAVLTTGDELVDLAQTPTGSQIRNSNGPMLVALLDRLGCTVTNLGIAPDKPEQIRAAIENGLASHDLLFVSGGMSMGTYDYVPKLLVDLGVSLKITKLRIKPGKPFIFGAKGDRFVFGLPGNPVSAFACTTRLASRLITRLAGGLPEDRFLPARLTQPLGANGPREFYQPVRLEWTPDGPLATPLPWRGSADLFTLAAARGLMVRPENDVPQPAGATIKILEI